ncbi:MAG: TRAP-type transport system large permease protein [Bacillota bacterium]|nr:TRAP-type transport system large permease protein [Bacillota bacterium]
MTATLFIAFVAFVLLGVPVSFVLGIASLIALVFIGGYPLQIVVQRMFTAVDSFALMAIPFFMLAGGLMDKGGITRRIVDFANALVGFLRGGLAHIAIVSGVVLAGISGSAVADTAAIGSILVPEMTKRGYDRDFSAAMVASAGIIGPIIPPSIPMIIYGVIAQISIGDLFMAGIVPGLLIGVGLMFVAYRVAVKRGYPTEERLSNAEKWQRLKNAIWAILMPLIIIVGIRGGIFTPTEGGVVASVYGLLVGMFIYKELKPKDLPKILGDAVISTASVSFLIATASLFSWILGSERIPQAIAAFFLSISTNKYVILFLINVLLLIVGMFLDVAPAIILLMPVLLPLVSSLGVDLVHFGLIVTLNLAIGLLTPPVGTALYVACNIAKVSLADISKAVLRFIAVILVVLFLVTYVPAVTLWVPHLFK